jgi:hypothetical protein
MPLGSESALGLAGPNGTPDIDELPAPAEPAGGVNCANALTGAIRASAVKKTSAGLRDIEVSPGSHMQRSCGVRVPLLSARRFFLPSVLQWSMRRRENQA